MKERAKTCSRVELFEPIFSHMGRTLDDLMKIREFKKTILNKMKKFPLRVRIYVNADLNIENACPFLLVGRYEGYSINFDKAYEFVKFYCGGIFIPDINPIRTSISAKYVMQICMEKNCPLIKSWKR